MSLNESPLGPNDRQERPELGTPSLGWVFLAAVAALGIEASGPMMVPIRAWLVGSHEFFHALAAWLTGASVESIRVDAMHGLTMTRGGLYPLISCAGYVGTGAFGALCLRYCGRVWMRYVFETFCVALGLALVFKSGFSPGFGFGLAWALGVDALALWVVRLVKGPFLLALAGCLYLAFGLDDLRALLFYATSQTDAGLLARWMGLPALAWPIALAYGALMALMWFWAARGLAREAWAGRRGSSVKA